MVRSSTGRYLRQAYPERYEADDPYAEPLAQPSRRPPAQYRHRSSRTQSEVRLLAGEAMAAQECACGWGFDTRAHNQMHTSWSVGVQIPQSIAFPEPIAVVDTMAPKRWRQLAYDCARIAQRDGRYDFASFDLGDDDPEPSKDNLRAYLMRVGGRVVGYLSALDRDKNAFWDFDTDSRLTYVDGPTRSWVNLIFVAREWRRRVSVTH